MPKKYDPKVKEAFFAAAKAAREEGKNWDESARVAKAKGYQGSSASFKTSYYQYFNKSKEQVATVAAPDGTPLSAQVEAMVQSEVKRRLERAKAAAFAAFEAELKKPN